MTDEEIMDVLVSGFTEAKMSNLGPAIRHRKRLQVLGFVEHKNGVNQFTVKGREFSELEGIPRTCRCVLP